MNDHDAKVLAAKRDILEARLDDGWARIDKAEKEGKNIDAWEQFWGTLLKEYRDICDQLAKENDYV